MPHPTSRATYDPDSLVLGVIGRPHGVRGEMALRAYNQSPSGADLSGVPCVVLDRAQAREERQVRAWRRSPGGWLMQLDGVDTRSAAAALLHLPVRVARRFLPPLAPGEFFVEDVLGCVVEDESGLVLGMADDLFWNGAHDVLSVVPAASGAAGEVLIPLVPAHVRAVDVAARRLVVDWSEQKHD